MGSAATYSSRLRTLKAWFKITSRVNSRIAVLVLVTRFLMSAGFLLAFTGIAKLVSSAGGAPILRMPDPILAIPFRYVLLIVGIVEVAIGCLCICDKRIILHAAALVWLTTSFLVYRVGLYWVGYQNPCSCLGNLTDALHIPPSTAELIMKLVLVYLLSGSYASVFCLLKWRVKAGVRVKTALHA